MLRKEMSVLGTEVKAYSQANRYIENEYTKRKEDGSTNKCGSK